MKDTNKSLDLVRGCAAVLVLLAHTRSYFFEAQGLGNRGGSAIETLLLMPTSLAKESVAVFFVLSGYLVGGQVVRQVTQDRFSWGTYLVKRLARLWPVLIPGIALTAIVDAAANSLFPGQTLGPSNSNAVSSALCNGFFLQGAHCGSYGTNDALWSLSYEFWFYVLFAATAAGIGAAARRRLLPAIAAGFVVVATVSIFGPRLFLLLPAWLIGVGVVVAEGRYSAPLMRAAGSALGRKLFLGAGMGSLLAGLLVSNLIQPPEPVQFALIGVAVAPLALALALLDPAPRRAGARSLLSLGAWIGTWSFSIYVFHLPVVRLLAMVLARVGRYPGLVEVLAVYVIGAVVVALIYPLWSLTERWSPLLRDTGLRLLQTCGRSLEVRGRRIPEPRGIAVPARSHAVGQHPEADSRTAAGG